MEEAKRAEKTRIGAFLISLRAEPKRVEKTMPKFGTAPSWGSDEETANRQRRHGPSEFTETRRSAPFSKPASIRAGAAATELCVQPVGSRKAAGRACRRG